jgi:AcrR family transcriptional regulator
MDRKKNRKRLNILAASKDLFWKHGFRRISVHEICEKAGVSKMTFYKYFPNKTELAKTVFEDVVEDGMVKFNMLMKEDIPASEKLEKLMLFKLENTNNISREFLEDFYMGTEPELREFVEQLTRETWNNMRTEWARAQEEGIFRKDLKTEFLIHISFGIIEMMKDEKLAKLYTTPQEMMMEFTKFIFYGISPRH